MLQKLYFFLERTANLFINQKIFVIKSKPNSRFDVEIAAGEKPKNVFAKNIL